MQLKTIALAGALSMSPAVLYGQFDFHLAGREVQVHGFASQAFAYTNQNNYLTMKTSDGSFAFTDAGLNASMLLTDKLRIGAQVYDRNVGKLGNWRPTVDWAFADYRFKDWLGIRAGKVKTVLGLYNDVQDTEFLHTWALMPQSLYPVDRRGDAIAHYGGDLYGEIALPKLGGLSYTIYGGFRPNDSQGGYLYAMSNGSRVTVVGGLPIMTGLPDKRVDSYDGPMYGGDLKWNTPLPGLLLGVSFVNFDITSKGIWRANNAPYFMHTNKNTMFGYSLSYRFKNLAFDGEFRKENRVTTENNSAGGLQKSSPKDLRGGYVALAYRFTKWLEAGSYHSRYYYQWALFHSDPNNHVFDQALTVRFDLNSHLNLKVEGHFLDGNITSNSTNRGFYVMANPQGLRPSTRLFLVRLGFHI